MRLDLLSWRTQLLPAKSPDQGGEWKTKVCRTLRPSWHEWNKRAGKRRGGVLPSRADMPSGMSSPGRLWPTS